jgi:hypothetical protein
MLDPGFRSFYAARGEVLMHELGHVMGLEHVEDTFQLMHPQTRINGVKYLARHRLQQPVAQPEQELHQLPIRGPDTQRREPGPPPSGAPLVAPAEPLDFRSVMPMCKRAYYSVLDGLPDGPGDRSSSLRAPVNELRPAAARNGARPHLRPE